MGRHVRALHPSRAHSTDKDVVSGSKCAVRIGMLKECLHINNSLAVQYRNRKSFYRRRSRHRIFLTNERLLLLTYADDIIEISMGLRVKEENICLSAVAQNVTMGDYNFERISSFRRTKRPIPEHKPMPLLFLETSNLKWYREWRKLKFIKPYRDL